MTFIQACLRLVLRLRCNGMDSMQFGGWMPYRSLLLTAVVLANVTLGFTQTLGDAARAERARREVLNKKNMSEAPATETPATVVGREALIKEALRASGAKRQLERLLETSLPSIANGPVPKGVSAQEYRRLVNDVFGVERLMPVMEKSVSNAVTDKTLTDILRWYRSPLGKKIAAAEVNTNAPDAPARLEQFASTLSSNPPTATRQQLIEDISATVPGISRRFRDFEKTVTPPEPETESITEAGAVWYLFAYNSLSEDELSAYLSFLKSPSVTAFVNSVWNAMDATFGDAAQRFAQKLAEKKR